jgi:hypothetical protein
MKSSKHDYCYLKEGQMPKIKLSEFLSDRPFFVTFLLYCIYTGVAGLIGYGSSSEAFNNAIKIPIAFNILAIVLPIICLISHLREKLAIEVGGIFMLASLITGRILAIVLTDGFLPNTHNFIAINTMFVISCVVRISFLVRISRI